MVGGNPMVVVDAYNRRKKHLLVHVINIEMFFLLLPPHQVTMSGHGRGRGREDELTRASKTFYDPSSLPFFLPSFLPIHGPMAFLLSQTAPRRAVHLRERPSTTSAPMSTADTA